MTAGRSRPLAFFFALSILAAGARADVGALSVSTDYDAELARASDLLEQGDRASAEQILREVRRLAGQRAYDARIDFLLALDDERHGKYAAAAERLASFSAAPIGLEPYRRDRLARNLAAAGQAAEALREYRTLETGDEPYAGRARTALDLARLLEKSGAPSVAAGVLSRAAAADPSSSLELAPDRLRLALRLNDSASVAALSRELLLEAPLVDRSDGVGASVRRALRREEAALSAADRARRGRALIAAGDARHGVPLLRRDSPGAWPPEERNTNWLALAAGQEALGQALAALATLSRVPRGENPESYEARLGAARIELAKARARGASSKAAEKERGAVRASLLALTGPAAPVSVRAGARERLIQIAYDGDDFDAGLEQARLLVAESPGTRAGFEPLWRLAWALYLSGDCAAARARFDALASLYPSAEASRRLAYWRARCLEREGDRAGAEGTYRELAAGNPPDLYALFARRRAPHAPSPQQPSLADPSNATATFRRVDELLRMRLFEEASAEARLLPASRGRDLRLAESEFALGRFAAAAQAAKRAFPEMGTAEEARVPDAWRRLYYPIEIGGFLADRAREFRLDPAILRGLVRQESLFEANAKSRAGALGLTQLLPTTAASVAHSVLRMRYRKAFLYDPGVNARIGAAYLRRLYDRFDDNAIFALAAYNGGPGRMESVRKHNPGLSEDELFESHPAPESRDYVRRVMLYAESYRELYPD